MLMGVFWGRNGCMQQKQKKKNRRQLKECCDGSKETQHDSIPGLICCMKARLRSWSLSLFLKSGVAASYFLSSDLISPVACSQSGISDKPLMGIYFPPKYSFYWQEQLWVDQGHCVFLFGMASFICISWLIKNVSLYECPTGICSNSDTEIQPQPL